MSTKTWSKWIVAVALGGAVSLPLLGADEKPRPGENVDQQPSEVAVSPVGGSWLGVFAVPIDEPLQAQLGLKHRLIVRHVVPDSPAAKAGLQAHDILLKFGDRELSVLDDLMRAVSESEDQTSKVIVLRAGKEQTLEIRPEPRPADQKLKLPQVNDVDNVRKILGKVFQDGLDADGDFIFRAIGPGVLSKEVGINLKSVPFPNGLSLSVSKQNDQPATITAKRDGETYETTEDRLDVLPEDIRPLVERLLTGPKSIVFGKVGKGMPGAAVEMRALEELKKAQAEAAKALRQRIEIRKLEDGPVQELRKAVEALRKEVQQLKGKSQSSSDRKAEKADKFE